jgi:hypothetical protein
MSATETPLFAGNLGRAETLPSMIEITNRQYTHTEMHAPPLLHPPIKRSMAKRRAIALPYDYSDRHGNEHSKKKMHFYNNFFLFFLYVLYLIN